MPQPKLVWRVASAALLSLLVAYAFHPLTYMGTVALEPYGVTFGHAVLAVVWLVQAIALIVSFILLFRVTEAQRRIRQGLLATGVILLLSLPLFVTVALQEVRYDLPADPKGVIGTILSGLLFSGHYGVLGVVSLSLGALSPWEKRSNRASPSR